MHASVALRRSCFIVRASFSQSSLIAAMKATCLEGKIAHEEGCTFVFASALKQVCAQNWDVTERQFSNLQLKCDNGTVSGLPRLYRKLQNEITEAVLAG